MANIVQIAVQARSTAAAVLTRTQAQIRATNAAIQRSSFVTRQHTQQVIIMSGVYRDANGRLRDAQGHFVSNAVAIRTTTTAYGRLHNAIQRTTRALVAYTIASRLARALSDRTASTMVSLAGTFGLFAAKAVAALAVVLPLIGAIGNIIPIVMLLAPAIGTAALLLVGLKLAFNGVGEALQAGLSGDTEAFEKALKKLAPQAADTVRVLVKLRDTWKPLVKDFQGRVFEGAAGEIKALSGFIKPVVDNWLPKLGLKFAAIRKQLSDGLANFAADGRLEAVFRNLYVAVSGLLDAVPLLGRAFGDILEVAAPRFAQLSEGVGSLAKRFADWIRESKDSGQLQEWLDKAIDTMGQLKDIAGNVMEIIGAIFHASGDEGTDMLTQIEESTQRIADWANGGQGQGVINFFSNLMELLGQVAPVFAMWSGWFESMVFIVKNAWDGISSIFRAAVAVWLGYLEALLYGAVKAFGWIPGIGPKLKGALADFQAFKDGVNAALGAIEDETVNIVYRGVVAGDHRFASQSNLSGEYSSGTGGRAAGGPGGAPKQVNEWGNEIVDFAKGMVYNANESKRMQAAMAGGGGGGGNWTLSVEASPGQTGNWLAKGFLDALDNGLIKMKVTPSNRAVRA
ncbi:MAG: hypothetical protein V4515_14450 [Chloroflexota bacterium]